jgi:hypothetical protein
VEASRRGEREGFDLRLTFKGRPAYS